MVKAASTRQNTIPTRPLEYNQLPWGDLIYGTKDQLRSLGIAVDIPFPGEDGGSKRRLRVIDPRGFKCQIEACAYREEGVYCASIPLPGREAPEPPLLPFAAGVLSQENTWSDDYLGTADALVAAGLIRLDQLPGQPGMRKVIVTLLPDGSPARASEAHEAGAKQISRASQGRYRVAVFVDDHERSRRYDAYARSRREWEERMGQTPRPAPLHARLLSASASQDSAPAIPRYRAVGNVIYLARS